MTEPAKSSEVCSRMRKRFLSLTKMKREYLLELRLRGNAERCEKPYYLLGGCATTQLMASSSSGLGYRPLTPATGVRISLGSPGILSPYFLCVIMDLSDKLPPAPRLVICGTKEWETLYPKTQSNLTQIDTETGQVQSPD